MDRSHSFKDYEQKMNSSILEFEKLNDVVKILEKSGSLTPEMIQEVKKNRLKSEEMKIDFEKSKKNYHKGLNM